MAKHKKLSGRAASIFLLIFGLVFATIGAGLTYWSYSFSQSAITTSGIVTHVTTKTSRNSTNNSTSTTYQPTVSYIDQSGATHSAQTFLSSSGYNFPLGSEIEIMYDPEDTGQIRINSWFALWGFGFVFLAVGLITTVISLVVWRVAKRRAAGHAPLDVEVGNAKSADFSYRPDEPEEDRPPTVRRH